MHIKRKYATGKNSLHISLKLFYRFFNRHWTLRPAPIEHLWAFNAINAKEGTKLCNKYLQSMIKNEKKFQNCCY